MELVPVVEVIEVDSVTRVTVGETCGAEDLLAGFIGVNVSGDSRIELMDCFIVDLGAVLADPFFALNVGRLGGDKREKGVAV